MYRYVLVKYGVYSLLCFFNHGKFVSNSNVTFRFFMLLIVFEFILLYYTIEIGTKYYMSFPKCFIYVISHQKALIYLTLSLLFFVFLGFKVRLDFLTFFFSFSISFNRSSRSRTNLVSQYHGKSFGKSFRPYP